MIDIHSHILPNLDDGAQDWNDALTMAELSVESGVTVLVATPHCGLPDQSTSGLLRRVQTQLNAFRSALNQTGLPLDVREGMEIFGTENTARLLDMGLLTTLNGSRYPLIEFPFRDYARSATRVLNDVLSLGYIPVVAHPERYLYVQRDPALLNLWTDMGCLFQMNRGSLLGRFGHSTEDLAWSMLDRGFVCAIASDAHSPQSRTTWMKDVRELLREEYSEKTAQLLLEVHPHRLLQDETIHVPEPDWF